MLIKLNEIKNWKQSHNIYKQKIVIKVITVKL